MNKSKTNNKPIGLAVTLVILVICLMLNIIFISKNIAHKQHIQVETGNTIVALLKDVQDQALFIDEFMEKYEGKLNQADSFMQEGLHEMMVYQLQDLKATIKQLYTVTVPIDSALFSASAQQGEVPRIESLLERLEQEKFTASHSLSEEITTLVKDVQASTELFNYKLEGVKTAMIRMSNGFEWKESLLQLDQHLSK